MPKIKKKKEEGMSISTIILLILGVVILAILVAGISMGWDKIFPFQNTQFTITENVCEEKTNYYFTCEDGTNLIGIITSDFFEEVVLQGERCFRNESKEVICHEEEVDEIQLFYKDAQICPKNKSFGSDGCRPIPCCNKSKTELTTSWLDENAECVEWKSSWDSDIGDRGYLDFLNDKCFNGNIESACQVLKYYKCSKYKLGNYTIIKNA